MNTQIGFDSFSQNGVGQGFDFRGQGPVMQDDHTSSKVDSGCTGFNEGIWTWLLAIVPGKDDNADGDIDGTGPDAGAAAAADHTRLAPGGMRASGCGVCGNHATIEALAFRVTVGLRDRRIVNSAPSTRAARELNLNLGSLLGGAGGRRGEPPTHQWTPSRWTWILRGPGRSPPSQPCPPHKTGHLPSRGYATCVKPNRFAPFR